MIAVRALLALLLAFPLAAPALADDPPEDTTTDDEEARRAAEEEALRQADADLREKLKARLEVEAFVSQGVVDLSYSFLQGIEVDDFELKGFDISDIKDGGWTLGAGSRGAGLASHKLELEGDFTVELDVVVKHNTPSAVLAVVLNKKVAVLWGQQIVKTSGFKPWGKGAPADPTIFKEERRVTIKLERKGDTLVVEANKRQVGSHTFAKGELDSVRVGLMARNIRFVVSPLRIKGKPAD